MVNNSRNNSTTTTTTTTSSSSTTPNRRRLPNASNNRTQRATLAKENINRNNGRTELNSSITTVTKTTTTTTTNKVPEDETTIQCYQELKKIRNQLMSKHNIRSPGSILSDSVLKKVAKALPLTAREFQLVTSMQSEVYPAFGEPFLEVSLKYYNAKNTISG
ncbi:uncharacterized protein BX663DRAFT_39741 [Cokeromyces recurvatus]|uniref:uncharacterized protein n=1 Tax=Cokeromyces recurvatus TaxID=90255 RepID=UPI00222074A5|nr:uncharacterized protein BX663DRAFT_39741 [Cokeromyces recurvatus]KAI7903737.1 hypothetical protein BX663DRAFT_39741 [Cokeromyces recurvatus]